MGASRNNRIIIYDKVIGENKVTDQTPVDINDLINQGVVEAPVQLFGQDKKEALAEDGAPFTVTNISVGNDPQYGPYWQVMAILNGTPIQFRLSQHDRRDSFMSSLAAVTAKQPVANLRLVAYPGQGGNDFITVEPAK